VLSFHPSGYVREEAVLRLTALDDDAALPYLLLRCGDWVSQVRNAARHAVLQRAGPSSVATFTRNFALVTRLAKITRADHRELVDALAQLFRATEGEIVARAILATPSRAARAVAQFVIDEVPSLLPTIASFGPSMVDPVIARGSSQSFHACFHLTLHCRSCSALQRIVRRASVATLCRR